MPMWSSVLSLSQSNSTRSPGLSCEAASVWLWWMLGQYAPGMPAHSTPAWASTQLANMAQ